jgi:translation initiation factor eIF-2B subunit alpha
MSSPKEETLTIRDLRRHLSGIESTDSTGTTEANKINIYNADDTLNPTTSDLQANLTLKVALPVAAIKSLLGVIQRTKSETMMGLQKELKLASDEMISFANDPINAVLLGGRSHIALASGCDLFLKYITRAFLESPDFTSCIHNILSRGQRFSDISLAARDRIANVGQSFIRPGMVVLTHGWSNVVSSLLVNAAHDTHFEIIILEGRPDASGAKAASQLYASANIPTTIVLDSAMAYVMEKVDMVIVGAEGVVENGGIINKIGTYAMAIAAKEHKKPFYVAAESFKFARLFPLNQSDLPVMGENIREKLNFVDTACWIATGGVVGIAPKNENNNDEQNVATPGLVDVAPEVKVDNPLCDYTPAKYITLLFTDLGVLTPSAVSDELIKLYQ